MTDVSGREGPLGELRQFWSRQIAVFVASAVLTVVSTLRFSSQLTSVPPAGLEALSTGFATLLGLTFTAFSIVATFMPGLRPDFVRSRSFEMIGRTFVIAMITQGATFSLATIGFVLYSSSLMNNIAPVLVFTAIASLGLLAKLGDYMYSLFRMARHGATR